MSVFVDTSVWINYFAGHGTIKTKQLLELIESGQPLYSLPVIIQEIMQGLKNDKDINDYTSKIEGLNFLPFELQDSLEAAKMYRSLRKQGITSSTIDLQIAYVCIRYKLQLLTEDKDFLVIAKKLNLSLA